MIYHPIVFPKTIDPKVATDTLVIPWIVYKLIAFDIFMYIVCKVKPLLGLNNTSTLAQSEYAPMVDIFYTILTNKST